MTKYKFREYLMRATFSTGIVVIFLGVLLGGCAPAFSAAASNVTDRTIVAVATTGMVGDVVKNVGGGRVQVHTLMGAGVDPHLYKASEGDVIRLGEADIIFYSGLHLEAGMGRVLERIGEHGARTVAITDGIPRDALSAPPEFNGQYDPHVWFDVSLWMRTVAVVRDALIELDPAHTETYRTNANVYRGELEALDTYVRQQAERVPADKRVLITAHDAFNYFGRAYGFEVRGLQGISTATEASTADVSGLVQFIVERQIPAIFIETSVPQRNVEAVQAAARSRGWQLTIGGELFSDAMGNPGSVEGTYVGMVRHNIDTIVNALLSTK
jgi:manganese/zinc/iron transport system substrate-binding protein